MKLFAVAIAMCALSQTAVAQTRECRSIADAGPRLACYDKAAPPAAAATSARAPVSRTDTAKYVDPIDAEEALMSARLKNICRGC